MSDSSENVLTRPRRTIPAERLEMTERLYLAGKSRARITSAICERYGVSARHARRYVEIIEKRLAALPKPDPAATFQRVESMLLESYETARDAVQRLTVSGGKGEPSRVEEFPQANVGVMVTATWRLAELHGIASQKIELTTDGAEDLSRLTEEEFAAMRALKAKLRGMPAPPMPALPSSISSTGAKSTAG